MAPPGKWYGALRQQVPHGKWMAYVYDLNRKEAIWHSFFNTAEEAKQALDLTALGLHGNRTNLNFYGSAAPPPPPMSGAAALESYWQQGDGAGYSHPGYMPWQSGGNKRETQGPEYIFWQGGDDEGLSSQFSEFHHWQHGKGRSR